MATSKKWDTVGPERPGVRGMAMTHGDSCRWRVPPEALSKIQEALDRWTAAVEATDMRITTKRTYIDHPSRFVRWLAGEYDLPRVERKGEHDRT